MKFKLAIGLPSYNEADSIRTVVKCIDDALLNIDHLVHATILNSDSCSTDGTHDVFLKTHTAHPKVSLAASRIGKGENLKNIFEYCIVNNFDGVVFMDTDLSYISESWIIELSAKLIEGYDAVFTRRLPRWNNGDLTYHLTYPILKSVYKANIHEPISGDFAFSSRLINVALSKYWNPNMLGYGVDFFLARTATDMKWCEVNTTGKKDHKLRSYRKNSSGFISMNPKFQEVLLTVSMLVKNDFLGRNRIETDCPVVNNSYGALIIPPSIVPTLDSDIEELKESLSTYYSHNYTAFQDKYPQVSIFFHQKDFIGVSSSCWLECLMEFIKNSSTISNNSEDIALIETIFLARVVGFFYDIQNLRSWYDVVEQTPSLLNDVLKNYNM